MRLSACCPNMTWQLLVNLHVQVPQSDTACVFLIGKNYSEVILFFTMCFGCTSSLGGPKDLIGFTCNPCLSWAVNH